MNSKVKNEVNKLINFVNTSNNIYIASHVNPDGDSIGSELALGLALRKIKRDKDKVKLLAIDKTPQNLKFLPGIKLIEEVNLEENIDLLITVDCSDPDRLNDYREMIDKAENVINIDHHKSNNYFGDVNIVDPKASSTGEIIYFILEYLGLEIDEDIATCLYVSLSTDTGSFKYDNTTSITHNIASKLIDKGININDITVNVYQNRPLVKTKLFIESLNSLELHHNNKVAIICVTQEMIKKCNAQIEDIDGFVEFIRDIDTVEVACILKELSNNEIKIGLRSKKFVDVAYIASKFGGGGHTKASGCTIYEKIEIAKEKILEEIKNNLR
ncbi:DHH family phosphoesterase [Thermohalobacter berrensis]|nr:bifunctional oligoribonuclease/PAP phosphatase NrnA [Thermohalobacter berrensis]